MGFTRRSKKNKKSSDKLKNIKSNEITKKKGKKMSEMQNFKAAVKKGKSATVLDKSSQISTIKQTTSGRHRKKLDVAKFKKMLEKLASAKPIKLPGGKSQTSRKQQKKMWISKLEKSSSSDENDEEEYGKEVVSTGRADLPESLSTYATWLENETNSQTFRMLNEQLYTSKSHEAFAHFSRNPEDFKVYHDGFSRQSAKWPLKPNTVIAKWLKKKPKNWIVADFGCGDAELSRQIPQKTHSLDLVAVSPEVIACNMAETPLETASVDVAVFCLSLMGTDLSSFVAEANRVLKKGGLLKIAEVESRLKKPDDFVKALQGCGFKASNRQELKYFWIFDFVKVKTINMGQCPNIPLTPCYVKKR